MPKLEKPEYAAEKLNTNVPRIWQMARDGLLPAGVVVKVGRQWRINPEELDRWIEAGGRGYEEQQQAAGGE